MLMFYYYNNTTIFTYKLLNFTFKITMKQKQLNKINVLSIVKRIK